MEPIDVVRDTIEFYKTNPCAMFEQACAYSNDEGQKCAVGRYMDFEIVNSKYADNTVLNNIGSVRKDNWDQIEELLLSEVKSFPRDLWEDLQNYHDSYLEDPLFSDEINEQRRKARPEIEESLIEKWSNFKN